MNEISGRIKLALERKGKTQAWLSEEIGVTQQTMCRYVHGKRIPKAPIMAKIADALGVDLNWLLTGKEEPTKHIEMIIDYSVDGDDFQYHDNKGILTRRKDCMRVDPKNCRCLLTNLEVHELDYCSKAVRKC